jgi:hypothetical protein
VVFPQFEQRLLTFVERSDAQDPMLELLAMDTREVARKSAPERVAPPKSIFAFATGAGAAGAVLLWLILGGPGFLGFGANLLWAGTPKSGVGAAYYDIQVTPGSKTVKRKWDVPITATLVGFQAPEVRLFTKFQSTTKWEAVTMLPRPASTAYEFNFAALSEPMEYYVEAAGVKSKTFKLEVVDLPAVTHITTTYHLPSWLGMKDQVEDPSGDLHAVAGTTAEVAITTDRPLANGAIEFQDGSKIPLTAGANGTLMAKVPIEKDGLYHFASLEAGDSVRLTADYFIEAQEDQPPTVRITHPGADAKVLPIEEVAINVQAEDDFALQAMDLHYSVNGTAEKVVPLLANKGVKTAEGKTLLALEDFKMQPGDIVSMYATAKDAKQQSQTDIIFIEAQPYERNYSQSQQGGGGGGGGGGGQQNDPNQILQRQQQIISATHKALQPKDKSATAENAKYLSDTELTLQKQVQSLVQRATARELTDNASVQEFAKEMTAAAEAMTPASDKLKGQKWQDAVTPEEVALNHLSRAAATFRDIQVAFGRQGGGGGGGGGANAGRDLANLFDLELDTQKNQYEQGSQSSTSEQRQKEADDAMRKLEELSRRQQELARQQQNSKQLTAEQKYEQSKLKREAEDLKKQIEQLQQQQQQQGQQQSQSQSGSQSQSQSGQAQSGQQQKGSQGRSGSASSQQMQRTLDQLNQAINDMNNAQRAQTDSQAQAEARKAAERLSQAADQANSARKQDAAGRVSNLKDRAEQLAQEQQDSENKLKQQFGDPYATDPRQRNPSGANSRQAGEEAAGQKEKEAAEVAALQKEIEDAARQLQTTQPNASRKLRDGLGELQQGQVQTRLQQQAQFFRQGYGNQLTPRETPITQSLQGARDALRQAEQAMQQTSQQGAAQQDREQQLANVESLRNQLQALQQQAAQRGQQGNQQGQGKQGQGKQDGQGKQGGQGKQDGKGQQGGQGQGGQQGNQTGGGNVNPNGGGYNNGGYAGPNGGPFNPNGPVDPRLGPNRQNYPGVYDPTSQVQVTPQELGNNIQRQLEELRRMYKDDPNLSREIQDLQATLATNKIGDIASPELADRIGRTVLPKLEQLEVEMRRQIDEKGTGQARSGVPDAVPEGYQPQVEEYTRKLSKSTTKP